MDPLIISVITSTAVTIAAIIVTAIIAHKKQAIMHQSLAYRTNELIEQHISALRKQHENNYSSLTNEISNAETTLVRQLTNINNHTSSQIAGLQDKTSSELSTLSSKVASGMSELNTAVEDAKAHFDKNTSEAVKTLSATITNHTSSQIAGLHDKTSSELSTLSSKLASGMSGLNTAVEDAKAHSDKNISEAVKTLSAGISHHTKASANYARLQGTNIINGQMKNANLVQNIEVSKYRITSIENIEDNTVTLMTYNEQDELIESTTKDSAKIIQRLTYKPTGDIHMGININPDGTTQFAVEYDEIGEIVKRVDYHYDKNNKLINTTEVTF